MRDAIVFDHALRLRLPAAERARHDGRTRLRVELLEPSSGARPLTRGWFDPLAATVEWDDDAVFDSPDDAEAFGDEFAEELTRYLDAARS